MTARQAASGRLAHQICRVEIWPCRIDFSRLACAEMRLIGKINLDEALGICLCHLALYCPLTHMPR